MSVYRRCWLAGWYRPESCLKAYIQEQTWRAHGTDLWSIHSVRSSRSSYRHAPQSPDRPHPAEAQSSPAPLEKSPPCSKRSCSISSPLHLCRNKSTCYCSSKCASNLADRDRRCLLEQDAIFAVPVVPVGGPRFHPESLGITTLSFEQDSSVFRLDDVHTLIVPNLFPDRLIVQLHYSHDAFLLYTGQWSHTLFIIIIISSSSSSSIC